MTTNRGEQGIEGRRGATGAVGHDGVAGPQGTSFSRLQVLFLFSFIVAALLLMAYRGERQDQAIQQAADLRNRQIYALCQNTVANASSLTAVIEQVIEAVEAQPPSQARDQRLITYTNAIPVIPDCGDKP